MVLATKSFQTDFKFTTKTASALANALQQSRRVDIKVTQPINKYDTKRFAETNKFDSFFGNKVKEVTDGR